MTRGAFSLLGAAVIALSVCASPAHASNDASSLRAEIADALKEEGLVGAVWAARGPDGVITTDAAGLMNASSGAPLLPNHKVQVGSVAKTVLAAGILRLVSEGRLQLDAPVTQLLPDVAFDNPWAAQDPVRVRHLLDHTSGLDDAHLWQVFSLKVLPDAPLSAAFAGGSPLLRLRTKPGTTMSYSNMGYALLGRIVEAVTGQRYETYLDENLLAPLGMKDSSFTYITQSSDPRLAMGHFENGAPHATVPQHLRPAGQFTTTAFDMALFAGFLLGDGKLGGQTFIDESLLRAMGRSSGTDAAQAGLQASYALGLNRRDRRGFVGLCHGGKTVGFSAMLCLYPEDRKAFFIALNADSETADYERFDAMLAQVIGITPASPPGLVPFSGAVEEWRGLYVPAPSRFETFTYLDHVFNFAALSGDQNRLRFKPLQANARELVPAGGQLFRAMDRSAPSHALLVNGAGEHVLSDGYQTFRKVGPWHIVLLWLSLALGVLGLAYILIAGLAAAARRSLTHTRPLFFPSLAVLALLLPIPLFFTQSFLALGDLTPASGTLAAVTGVLPFALIYGLVRRLQTGVEGAPARFEAVAIVGALQWVLALVAWGLVPVTLWT